MKRYLLILLTLTIVTGVGYCQAPIKRKKKEKTEQTQSSESKRQQEAEAKRKREAEAKRQREAETQSRQEIIIVDCSNNHEYVDLGLPSGLKWASCNVGANSPEQLGNYFAWGEIDPKSSYNDSNSVTIEQNLLQLNAKGIINSQGNLNLEYDVAHSKWEGCWRIPTVSDFYELIDNCTWSRSSLGGKNGYRITGSNGNYIFIPAGGWMDGETSEHINSSFYWSATCEESLIGAYGLNVWENDSKGLYRFRRSLGFLIRPVLKN